MQDSRTPSFLTDRRTCEWMVDLTSSPKLTCPCFGSYYERVRTALRKPRDLGDSYRFFEIPGMG